MILKVEVSAGELLDKITILQIKSRRIKEPEKLYNIDKELIQLKKAAEELPDDPNIPALQKELTKVNERLWVIEDQVRELEKKEKFDAEFIILARSVYMNNDERARIKREINELVGSEIIEEKSYAVY